MNGEKIRVAFHTLGCKLNYTETSTIARTLDQEVYEQVSYDKPADIYVINTCTVTGAADRKCRQAIRKASRQSPDAQIVVMGCFAQLRPEEAGKLTGVKLILGNHEKFNLAHYLKEMTDAGDSAHHLKISGTTGSLTGTTGNTKVSETSQKSDGTVANRATEVYRLIDPVADHKYPEKESSPAPIIHSCESMENSGFIPSFSIGDRTRSFMKVQDGCDYHCSYCTIPLARGNSRNQPISECIREARDIAARGIREIVLTGINTGDFGKSTGESLYELLQELVKTDGIERYRISSIEPNLLTSEIIELTAENKKLMPHFHIPLQSGSNETLARMRRRYQRELFAEKLVVIKELIPMASVGADVIVGFPGETEEEFKSTYRFLEESGLSYLHVFTYSPRSNTPAAMMKPAVKSSDATDRSRLLQQLSGKMAMRFSMENRGYTRNVLWENRNSKGILSGFTDNYIRLTTLSLNIMPGDITRVLLKEPNSSAVFSL